ncbi:MAG TPA: energy transducer TonB [Candidatus Sulfopaludibacter sp.]|jgi:TonB family protein|nr:energy transducer TonB [Candidatus Sulfopaludibacter sp.]
MLETPAEPRNWVAAVPVVLFLLFIGGVLLSPATPRAVVPDSRKSDVKPDALYRQDGQAPAPAATASAAPEQSIIYFAPISGTLPVVVSTPSPALTAEARAAKVQGTVAVRIKIDTAGNVGDPLILRGLSPKLDERALQAVINWHFQPARLEGKPVASAAWVEVPFR